MKPTSFLLVFFIVALTSRNVFAQDTQAIVTEPTTALILTTQFTVPLLRFNLFKSEFSQSESGKLKFLNSAGAGIGLTLCRLSETKENGKVVGAEINNTIGINIGFLFAADLDTNTKNIFAPTVQINILNFQFGGGYELGTKTSKENGWFVDLAYSIPLQKVGLNAFYEFWRDKKVKSFLIF